MKKTINLHQAMMLYVVMNILENDADYPNKVSHQMLKLLIQGWLNENGLPNTIRHDEDGIADIDYQLYGFPNEFNAKDYIFNGKESIRKPIDDFLDKVQEYYKENNGTYKEIKAHVFKSMPEKFKDKDGKIILEN